MKDRIKKLRADYGLNQQAFADLIGITRQYLSLLENGQREPSDLVLNAVCREFNVNRTWLETGEGEMRKQHKSDDLIPALREMFAGYPAIAKVVRRAMSVMTEQDFARLNEFIGLCIDTKEP